jgi:hypothetical protein
MGNRARETAERRFGLDRFRRDWNLAFQQAIALRRLPMEIERLPAAVETVETVPR